ncbi:hypothetical protein G6M89_07750 [Natronolimnobius sp. AArcel1]|uniref:CRISPR-associated protein Cas4 n=1 Tax=Natronolimnobius sp. AArcel1 TaxID=1679093 RepID=UPI0013ED1F58|nr:hypothetical protein [Natronolimnobius sp. AArcel1]NGM68905.1 hypothetical protein [Natronolimnobius sp. AArcel1]
MSRQLVAFSDLRTAAYCPRKCYYQRRQDQDDREPPPSVESIRALSSRYADLLEADLETLAEEPFALEPAAYQRRLETTRDRLQADGQWERLCDPEVRNTLLTGRDCRGIVHKVLADPLEPVLVSTGKPPEQGVWEPQSVQAVAAAKALGWEHETPIERAWLEYPAYGVIRSITLTTRRKARYRRALRTVRGMDGPPARTSNRSKCEHCEFADECGVRTRTLRSLLGFG